MKLCKDCKHCVPPSISSLALCGHEKAERSPYDGCLVEVVHFARTPNGICGPDAKLFEQREPEPRILTPSAEEIAQLKKEIDMRSKQYKQDKQDSARVLLMYGVCIAFCIAALATGLAH
jgi:hypothetical protein